MNIFEKQQWVRALRAPNSSEILVDGIFGPKTRRGMLHFVATNANDRSTPASEWTDERLGIAFEQYVMRTVGGLAAGPIDGIAGPVTERARKHWRHGPWRSELLQKLPGDHRFPKTLGRWPEYNKLREFFGEPGQNQVRLRLPFPMRLAWDPSDRVTSVLCHEAVHDPLREIWQNVLAHYGMRKVQKLRLDQFGGCLNVRPMRGSTRLSTHAWGIAWDVDPVENALRYDKTQARLARPEYKPFWDIVTASGATSLGKARDFDWMHFQFSKL